MQNTANFQSISTESLLKELLLYIFDSNTESNDYKAIFQELKSRLS